MKYIFLLCMSFVFFTHWEGLYAEVIFEKHEIIRPQVEPMKNSCPHKVWLHDVDNDGKIDIIASHVSWKKSYIHPYVAWYKGPEFQEEFIILDEKTVGKNSKILHFAMFDVDEDGKKDLIGQGYHPFHNGNKWYRCPDDPTLPWTEFHDYGVDLNNGHDIRLWDIDNNGQIDVVLMDSHSGKIIVKPIPKGEKARSKWPFYTIAHGKGMTHYMSVYDVNGDGFKDIVIGKEEDGGDGIRWFEHPGNDYTDQIWRDHFEVDANFTKVFARDLDGDGDVDFIGTGEFFYKPSRFSSELSKIKRFFGYPTNKSSNKSFYNRDFGWYERVSENKLIFHEFDKEDNQNDVIGGHNCELVDVDGDGDEDLIVGGVDVKDMTQRFRWYEKIMMNGHLKWIEHPIGVTSAAGWKPEHGFYCGEMTWGDIDRDGDLDLVYSGQGSGFLGWFENKTK